MPSTVQNTWFFLGAAVVGIVSAASVFIAEHYRQEKRRHAMAQDLARLDRQVSGMRKELEELQAFRKDGTSRPRRAKRSSAKNSSALSTTTEDYNSALDMDSSDMEFYDLSDDDESDNVRPPSSAVDKKISTIDQILDTGEEPELQDALEQLEDLCLERNNDPELLWRIGKCHHKIFRRVSDSKVKEDHINKGIEACSKALDVNNDLADSHKWYAVLIGSRAEFQPIKTRIADGHTFKKHVDIALTLKPDDPSLHHMLGRFAYEVASLKWYERKAASALFSEPPSATYEEALKHLLEAEELNKGSWKENKLLLAKCHFSKGDLEEGWRWLEKADALQTNEDETILADIEKLKEKYSNHR